MGVAVILVVAGCGDDDAGRDTASVTTTVAASTPMTDATPPASQPTEPTRTFTPVGSAPGVVPEALRPIVDIAVADLAGRLGVDAAEITTVSARDVTWPDGSAGCPQPGMNYIQVQVDGSEVVLQVAGTTYRYTSGGTRGPTLCANG